MTNNKGFTLIELMITVLVLAVLVAIALPSYQEQVRKGKRSEAMQALLAASEAMERYKAANFSYNLGTDLSDIFQTQVPVDGGTATYNLTLTSNATSYTLTATGVGTMNGDCTLSISNAGLREKTGSHCDSINW